MKLTNNIFIFVKTFFLLFLQYLMLGYVEKDGTFFIFEKCPEWFCLLPFKGFEGWPKESEYCCNKVESEFKQKVCLLWFVVHPL